jgi:hypothetical protein
MGECTYSSSIPDLRTRWRSPRYPLGSKFVGLYGPVVFNLGYAYLRGFTKIFKAIREIIEKNTSFRDKCNLFEPRGSVVVKALYYKLEGRGFETQ